MAVATSHTTTHPPVLIADAPPPAPRRPRVLVIGAALAAAASALTILTMLAAYVGVRSSLVAAGESTLPEGVTIPLTPGTMNLFTLIMSTVTAAWIVYSLRNGDRIHAYLALGLTLLFGVAFITQNAYLFIEMNLAIAGSTQGVLIHAISGAHVAMVIGGLVFLAVMGFQAFGGQLTGRDAEAMTAATLYWYVTVGVYAAIWLSIYVTK
jgi:heme/copper-type cytochrome/quinol oxidase subunit 3